MDGVPARYLPDELRGRSKESMQMIDLSMLRRRPDAQYRVDSEDVLAVYIENILGRADQPPVNQPVGQTTSQLNGYRPPTLGYPLTVRDDGAIAIPRFGPILVRGRTMPEVENLVRSAFTQQQRYLTPTTQNRVVVSLHQPRLHRVLVFRQDSEIGGAIPTIDISNGRIGNSNRGNGKVVALPSGKNGVLHALVESGGLPGLDARDTIWIIRSKQTPKPINQVAYNGIPRRGAPIPIYPQQQMMMPPGYPPPQQMMPQQMMPQPGMAHPPGAALPGHSGPAVGSTDSGHGAIQQAGYWMMQTPKQVAENLTGIPMPPRVGPGPLTSGYSAIKRGVQFAAVAVTGAGASAVSTVSPNLFGQSGVLPAGCQSCQTGPQIPMNGAGFGQPPMVLPPRASAH